MDTLFNQRTSHKRRNLFNQHTGQFKDTNVKKERQKHTRLTDVCDLLCVPIPVMGELVRSANEAKSLCECSIVANKLKILWPQFSFSASTFQYTQKYISANEGLRNIILHSPYTAPFDSLFRTCSEQQKESIERLCTKLKKVILRLVNIMRTLKHFADLNASIGLELSMQDCPKLSHQKTLLSQIEFLIVQRIDWIVNGCCLDKPVNTQPWDVFIKAQSTAESSSTKRVSQSAKRIQDDDDDVVDENDETINDST
ncbi:hypothetical protein AKO1_013908, partial [Acrasis kona]